MPRPGFPYPLRPSSPRSLFSLTAELGSLLPPLLCFTLTHGRHLQDRAQAPYAGVGRTLSSPQYPVLIPRVCTRLNLGNCWRAPASCACQGQPKIHNLCEEATVLSFLPATVLHLRAHRRQPSSCHLAKIEPRVGVSRASVKLPIKEGDVAVPRLVVAGSSKLLHLRCSPSLPPITR